MMKRPTDVLIALILCFLAVPLKAESRRGEAVLLISQAQFSREKLPDGSEKLVPGAAKLVIARPGKQPWSEEVIEDPESNVFHKAMVFHGKGGDSILTIGATKARLKRWRKKAGTWVSETLWSPSFGGKFDRLRDVEVGDVTGDGRPEIVVATHDQGVVAVLRKKGARWVAEELARKPNTFVHEVEIGDVNADGLNEFFVTPSDRNRATFESQPGRIVMFRWNGKRFERTVVDSFANTHAKEILLADVEGKGRPSLFAAVEAETKAGEGGEVEVVRPVRIRKYELTNGAWRGEDIATLEDRQCRFLTSGDMDGDGKKEIVAAAMSSGLWLLGPAPGGKWKASLIDADSSGYEHASSLADLDGDGRDELYVASDDQREIRRYSRKNGKFEKEVILPIRGNVISWNVMPGRL